MDTGGLWGKDRRGMIKEWRGVVGKLEREDRRVDVQLDILLTVWECMRASLHATLTQRYSQINNKLPGLS